MMTSACPTCGRPWISRRFEIRREEDLSSGYEHQAVDVSVACYAGHRYAVVPGTSEAVGRSVERGSFPILLPATLRSDG